MRDMTSEHFCGVKTSMGETQDDETQDDETQDARPEGIDLRLMIVDFGSPSAKASSYAEASEDKTEDKFLKGLSGYPSKINNRSSSIVNQTAFPEGTFQIFATVRARFFEGFSQ